MRRTGLILAFVSIGVVGCASTQAKNDRIAKLAIGLNETSVIKQFGIPTRQFQFEDKKVYEYQNCRVSSSASAMPIYGVMMASADTETHCTRWELFIKNGVVVDASLKTD